MSNYLSQKAPRKRDEIAAAKRAMSATALVAQAEAAPGPRGFAAAIERAAAMDGMALITEIKRTSPSNKRKGGAPFRAGFDPAALADAYAAGGAACLSVLTDTDFDGAPQHLHAVREATDLPVLRKDFMLDEYQILEARAWGADCILLIMAMLDDALAKDLEQAALALGLDVLVEVHDATELARALQLRARLVGINNRDLQSLRTSLRTTEELAPQVPSDRLVVSESGIVTHADMRRLSGVGARAFLVGESLMRQSDVAAATRALLAPMPAGPTVAVP